MKKIPVLGFCAYSGTGKTTLLTQLLPMLSEMGVCIGVIKHAHHNFDVDHPGKDSYRLRKSGAKKMLISSSKRWALMHEHYGDPESNLNTLIEKVSDPCLDLILVEGFKREPFDKIELNRKECEKPPIYPQDPNIVAFVTNDVENYEGKLPVLDIDDIPQLCKFIIQHCKISVGG